MAYNFVDAYTEVDGVMPILYSVRDAVPLAYEAVLVVFLLIITGASFFAATRISTRGRAVVSFAAASFVTAILSVFFLMMRLIEVESMIFFIAISIVSFIALVIYK